MPRGDTIRLPLPKHVSQGHQVNKDRFKQLQLQSFSEDLYDYLIFKTGLRLDVNERVNLMTLLLIWSIKGHFSLYMTEKNIMIKCYNGAHKGTVD